MVTVKRTKLAVLGLSTLKVKGVYKERVNSWPTVFISKMSSHINGTQAPFQHQQIAQRNLPIYQTSLHMLHMSVIIWPPSFCNKCCKDFVCMIILKHL